MSRFFITVCFLFAIGCQAEDTKTPEETPIECNLGEYVCDEDFILSCDNGEFVFSEDCKEYGRQYQCDNGYCVGQI